MLNKFPVGNALGLVTIDRLNEHIHYYDQMEAHIARERYERHQLLTQVEGVGVHTVLSFMLTIGEAERFEKSRVVGPFRGMRPRKKDPGKANRSWESPKRAMNTCERRW